MFISMFTIRIKTERGRRAVGVAAVAMAAAVAAVLCGGCSDNGLGGAFDDQRAAKASGNYDFSQSCGERACKTKEMPDGRVWMTENVNYETSSGSYCYGNSPDSCGKYGRLYTWEAAKKACPSGWHLPSGHEWYKLVKAAGGSSSAGKKLKSTTGWYNNGKGTDEYGFSALPGCFRDSDGHFLCAGTVGYWWTATEGVGNNAYTRYMRYDHDRVYEYYDDKGHAFSVRCVED